MNQGERDELKCKIFLVYLRDNRKSLLSEQISSVGFMGTEFKQLPTSFDCNTLSTINEKDLYKLASSLGIGKAPTGAKADVEINGVGVSLKSQSAAPAALVNHTNRIGFQFACLQSNTDIKQLDDIIDEYWRLRMSGRIAEDVKNSDPICPFLSYKNYMKPILEYFLFSGTGSKISNAPAEYLIEFENPVDIDTYKKLTKSDAVDAVWPKLVFSLRAKKGMPKDYNPDTYTGKGAESIKKWVMFHSDDYRGALHIRATK